MSFATALGRMVGPARAILLLEFLKFGVVGTIGFVVDTSTVYALRGSLGLRLPQNQFFGSAASAAE